MPFAGGEPNLAQKTPKLPRFAYSSISCKFALVFFFVAAKGPRYISTHVRLQLDQRGEARSTDTQGYLNTRVQRSRAAPEPPSLAVKKGLTAKGEWRTANSASPLQGPEDVAREVGNKKRSMSTFYVLCLGRGDESWGTPYSRRSAPSLPLTSPKNETIRV